MPATKTKPSSRAVKDAPAPYEAEGQYLPVRDKAAALDAIFKDTDHGLALFAAHEQKQLDLWQKGNKYYLHCLARQKKVLAKPEEVIRQLCLKRLLAEARAEVERMIEGK